MRIRIHPGGRKEAVLPTPEMGEHTAAEKYVSPRERDLTPEEAEVRRVAYSIKHPGDNHEDFATAARAMAQHVPKGAALVPIPSSIGDNGANTRLAEHIAGLDPASKLSVHDVLRRVSPAEPSHWRRKQGLPGNPPEAHRFEVHGEPPPEGPVAYVDNVGTTWATAHAAKGALGGRGWAVAYAKAKPPAGEKEVEWDDDVAKAVLTQAGFDPSHGGVLHKDFRPEFRDGKMVMVHRWRVRPDSDPAEARLVVPTTSSKMVDVARGAGMKIIIAVNGIRGSDWSDRIKGMNAAMDCIVSTGGNGKQTMSVDEYLRFVRVRDWSWYAGMDACVSPVYRHGVSPGEIELCQARTMSLYRDLQKKAASRSLKEPAPVIQGWSVEDYVRMAREMVGRGDQDWPRLVCIGSMCPRPVDGPNGMAAIIANLAKILPAHVGFHILGLDSSMSAQVSIHPRVTSIDSMRSRVLPNYPWKRPVVGPQSKYPEPLSLDRLEDHGKSRDNIAREYARLISGGQVDADTGYQRFLSDASKSWKHAAHDGMVHGTHYRDVNNPYGSLKHPLPSRRGSVGGAAE